MTTKSCAPEQLPRSWRVDAEDFALPLVAFTGLLALGALLKNFSFILTVSALLLVVSVLTDND